MDRMSLIRTVILAIALINQILVISGKSPLPLDDANVELTISTIFTIITSLWTWWKNNYISRVGQEQKEVLQDHDLYKP